MSQANLTGRHLQGKYVDSLIVAFLSETVVRSTTMSQVNRENGMVDVNAEVCQNGARLDG